MPRPTITSWAGPLFKRQLNAILDWLEAAIGSGGGVSDGDKGDVTVSGAGAVWTIDAGAVSLGKMADMATDRFLGRDTAGTGAPEVLSAAQARGILNVADGATANASDADLRDRSTHTGITVVEVIAGDPGAPVAGQIWINSTV